MPEFAGLHVETIDQIAHIWLNRPAKANALNGELWHSLRAAFQWVDATPAIRVVILEGAGEYFSAGIDFEFIQEVVAEVSELSPGHKEERLRRIIRDLQAAFNAVESCRKPVIAAVHGLCLGAGLDLIAVCDLRYASAEATFSLKEIDLGIVADIGSLQRLPYLIGEGLVRELAFTGRDVAAAEARQMGLLNQVFDDPAQLREGVTALARTIAAKSPLTVRGIKTVLNYCRDHSVASGLDYVATWNAAMLLSEDSQEAVLATLQKRTPEFKD